MKNIKWIALISVFLFLLSGCRLVFPINDLSPEEIYWDGAKYQSLFDTHLQYRQLSDAEKNGYGQLFTAISDSLNENTSITDMDGSQRPGLRVALRDGAMSKAQMARLFEAFFRDNPQFIHLDRTYSLEGQESNGKHLYDTFILQYTMDAEQRIKAINEMNIVIDHIIDCCPKTDDQYLIELYLHDRLVTLCDYDNDAAVSTSSEYADAYSAYGALVENKAVCEGYAKAMQLLLNKVAIPATVVFGQSAEDGEAHMWNLVRINGADYYLDPTWNDSGNLPQYAFFNITSDMLKRTHIIESGQSVPDECYTTTDNYFVRNGTYIDTYERETIAQAIAKQIQAGKDQIHLQFGNGKYENGLLFLKNQNLTQRLVNNHLDGAKLWEYELHTQSKQLVITLQRIQ